MSTILKTSTLEKLKPIRSTLLKISIWIFIAGVILGVGLILFGGNGWNMMLSYLRITGTLIIIATSMLIAVNNFKRLESENRFAGTLALIGLICNILCSLLWILLIWEIFPMYNYTPYSSYSFSLIHSYTFPCQLAIVTTALASFGFFGSNIALIGVKSSQKIVKPLKITALICLAYECLFGIVNAFIYSMDSRAWVLAVFAGFVWFIATIIAILITVFSNPSKQSNSMSQPKTEAELRAEIEAKVRAEMIEKEVRANLANAQPVPVQSTPVEGSNPQPMSQPAPIGEPSSQPTPQSTPPAA